MVRVMVRVRVRVWVREPLGLMLSFILIKRFVPKKVRPNFCTDVVGCEFLGCAFLIQCTRVRVG